MRILITGATGLIGKELGKALQQMGHDIVILSRNIESAKATLPFPAKIYRYTGQNQIPPAALEGVEVIYNLAGENIGEKRWSPERKVTLHQSRIKMTKDLVEAVRRQSSAKKSALKKFISVSAIGIYGDRGSEDLNESSELHDDFLATICRDWEQESQVLTHDNIQVINPRIGIVLSPNGGALDKLLPLFRAGIGSAVGSGKQWMSWIHLEDLVALFCHLLDSPLVGAVNAVAPNPTTNLEFSKTLAQSLHKGLFPKVPSFVLKLALGEMSTLVLSSQKVSSQKIEDDGFTFKYPQLALALQDITHNLQDGQEEFIVEQWIPKKPEEVFPFFCDENNLEKITPKFLNFKVLKKSSSAIQDQTIIDYRLSLHGLPIKWKTQILEWSPPHKFVDVQIKGPYHTWHHTHELIPLAQGTLLRDKVIYKLPFGFLGRLAAQQKVKSDVSKIFRYRRECVAREFYH